MKKYISLFIIGLAAFFLLKPNDFDNKSYDVRIVNGFSNNSSLPLVIWCGSDDGNDIGGRALQERDDYSWSVISGLWKTPQYICTMKCDGRRKKFEAFRVNRDRYRCGNYRQCFWLVKEDGFYFSNDEITWKKDFSWTWWDIEELFYFMNEYINLKHFNILLTRIDAIPTIDFIFKNFTVLIYELSGSMISLLTKSIKITSFLF